MIIGINFIKDGETIKIIITMNFNIKNLVNKKNKLWKKNNYFWKFIENRNKIHVTWHIINEIIGKKTNNIDEIITRNFTITTINELLSNFATNFKKNINKRAYTCNIKTINGVGTVRQNSLYLEYTNEEELFSILRTLKSRKGPGMDGIRPSDLENNASYLTPILTKFINLILENGIIPGILKTSLKKRM